MGSPLFTNGGGSVPNKKQSSDILRDVNLDKLTVCCSHLLLSVRAKSDSFTFTSHLCYRSLRAQIYFLVSARLTTALF